jgi:hypothetical protein
MKRDFNQLRLLRPDLTSDRKQTPKTGGSQHDYETLKENWILLMPIGQSSFRRVKVTLLQCLVLSILSPFWPTLIAKTYSMLE